MAVTTDGVGGKWTEWQFDGQWNGMMLLLSAISQAVYLPLRKMLLGLQGSSTAVVISVEHEVVVRVDCFAPLESVAELSTIDTDAVLVIRDSSRARGTPLTESSSRKGAIVAK